MKKLIALLLVVSTLFIFASCSMPPKLNLEKAAENLEDDYEVDYYDDEDDLDVDEAEYLEAKEKDGDGYIEITKFKTLKSARLYYKELKMSYDLSVQYYKAQIKAKKLQIKTAKYEYRKYDDDSRWDDDRIDDLKEQLEELQEAFREFKKESKFGIMGKTVWSGNADGLKDSKG